MLPLATESMPLTSYVFMLIVIIGFPLMGYFIHRYIHDADHTEREFS